MSAHSFCNSNGRQVRKAGQFEEGRSTETPLEVLIAAQPFFKGLSEQHLQILADSAMQTQFAPGQVIFRQGDLANRFYLIERGKVVVELAPKDDEPIVIQTLEPGRELGWSWVLPPYYEHFTARALEPTEAVFFYGTRLRAQCDKNHDLGYELMSRMAVVMLHRIEAASRRLLEWHAKHSEREAPPRACSAISSPTHP